MVSCDYKFHVL